VVFFAASRLCVEKPALREHASFPRVNHFAAHALKGRMSRVFFAGKTKRID